MERLKLNYFLSSEHFSDKEPLASLWWPHEVNHWFCEKYARSKVFGINGKKYFDHGTGQYNLISPCDSFSTAVKKLNQQSENMMIHIYKI